ncbi:TPA: hypothetical protein ACQZCP_004394 [Escherichia coli]
MNAIIHDYEATIAPGKAGKFETMPERISVEEINEVKIHPELF